MANRSIAFPLAAIAFIAIPFHASAEDEGAADRGNTIVVVDALTFVTTGVPKTVHERERFFTALRKELREKGWTISMPSAAPACDTDESLAQVAGDAGAKYAIRISGEGNLLHGYTLDLKLYVRETDQFHRAAAFCDLCATDRMASIAADFTQRLIADAAKERPRSREQDRQRAAGPPEARPLAPVPRPELTHAPTPARVSHVVPLLSSAMIAVGVVGIGYGSWALYKNGDATGNTRLGSGGTLTQERYSSATVGATSLAVGGALVLVAVILLVTEPTPAVRTALSPTPDGVALRF